MFSVVLCVLVTLVGSACDSGGGMNGGDDNDPPTAQLDASTTEAVVGDTVRLDAFSSSDPDGDGLSFSWSVSTPDGSDVSISGSGAEAYFVTDVDGDYNPEVEVSDGNGGSDDASVTVTALEKVPDKVTVSFENRAADGDSLITKDLELAGELKVSGKKSGAFTTAGSRESKELCAVEGEFFRRYCEEISLMSDRDEPVKLRPDRKEVTVAVTPVDSSGTVRPETVTKIYEPFKSDSMTINGQGSVELPKRSGQRGRFSDLIAEEPDSDKLDRAQANGSFAADEDVDLTVQLIKLDACSDGINSDRDPFVLDKNDPGCMHDDGFGYDPGDDNENHVYYRRTTGINFSDSTLVSGKPGEQSAQVRKNNNPFPESITVANGPINTGIEVLLSDTVSGQSYAARIESGGSSKRSDLAIDQDTVDGRSIIPLSGINRNNFPVREYAVYIDHIDKVEDNPPGDGSDWVIIGLGYESSGSWIHYFGYYYEPDHPDLQNSSQSEMDKATLTKDKCRSRLIKSGVCESRVVNGVKPARLKWQ